MEYYATFVCLYKVVEINSDDGQEVEKTTTINSKNIHSARRLMKEILDKSVSENTLKRYEIISIVPKLWKL